MSEQNCCSVKDKKLFGQCVSATYVDEVDWLIYGSNTNFLNHSCSLSDPPLTAWVAVGEELVWLGASVQQVRKSVFTYIGAFTFQPHFQFSFCDI